MVSHVFLASRQDIHWAFLLASCQDILWEHQQQQPRDRNDDLVLLHERAAAVSHTVHLRYSPDTSFD